MLVSLSIQQFVIVERLDLDLESGFTVMTGETGAGKSILIDAIDLILGGRSESSVVRQGADKADLAAIFDMDRQPNIREWCQAAGIDADDEQLLIRRTIDRGGKSKAWINGQAATLGQLKELGEHLIDIHGQHAHQALLRPNAQRVLLDAHAGLTEDTQTLARLWKEQLKLEDTLAQASAKSEQVAMMREQLQWKIDEIQSLKIQPGEWELLSEEQKRLSHAAELLQTSQATLATLDDDEAALVPQIDKLVSRLRHAAEKDSGLQEALETLQSGAIQLEESANSLRRYLDRTDLDPSRLAEVDARVEAIFSVSRKLKIRPEDLPAALNDAMQALAEAEKTANLNAIRHAIAAIQADFKERATKISSKRRLACQAISKAVNAWLKELAMGEMVFEAVAEPRPSPAAHGMEDIVFTLRNHVDGPAYPMSKVASGGELARISLAISVVTTSASQIPTLIFDEVDSGIGGNVAHTVGQLLRKLGDQRQVLCVTHLPQVAARGHQHLQVVKTRSSEGPPVSQLIALKDDARVDEIARMLGDEGAEQTSRDHARSLLLLR
jgi:DNA repair protein RecN (Recombination protein N)